MRQSVSVLSSRRPLISPRAYLVPVNICQAPILNATTKRPPVCSDTFACCSSEIALKNTDLASSRVGRAEDGVHIISMSVVLRLVNRASDDIGARPSPCAPALDSQWKSSGPGAAVKALPCGSVVLSVAHLVLNQLRRRPESTSKSLTLKSSIQSWRVISDTSCFEYCFVHILCSGNLC